MIMGSQSTTRQKPKSDLMVILEHRMSGLQPDWMYTMSLCFSAVVLQDVTSHARTDGQQHNAVRHLTSDMPWDLSTHDDTLEDKPKVFQLIGDTDHVEQESDCEILFLDLQQAGMYASDNDDEFYSYDSDQVIKYKDMGSRTVFCRMGKRMSHLKTKRYIL
jgi:hypothetical protein